LAYPTRNDTAILVYSLKHDNRRTPTTTSYGIVIERRMKWKEKDDLSWCCVSRRHSDDSNDANKQTKKVVLRQRSAETLSSPVEKVKKKREKEKSREKGKERKKTQKYIYFLLYHLLLLVFLICDL
jgi:hypothetical protein